MSRGLGRVERAILRLLEEERPCYKQRCWVDASLAATRLAEGVPTRAQLEDVRRAMRRLGELGLVEVGHVWDTTIPDRGATPQDRTQLAVHLPHAAPEGLSYIDTIRGINYWRSLPH
jgi:hypothetical protein